MTPEQIAKLIEMNKELIRMKHMYWNVGSDLRALLDMLERQQQIIEWLLERENERRGDGK